MFVFSFLLKTEYCTWDTRALQNKTGNMWQRHETHEGCFTHTKLLENNNCRWIVKLNSWCPKTSSDGHQACKHVDLNTLRGLTWPFPDYDLWPGDHHCDTKIKEETERSQRAAPVCSPRGLKSNWSFSHSAAVCLNTALGKGHGGRIKKYESRRQESTVCFMFPSFGKDHSCRLSGRRL